MKTLLVQSAQNKFIQNTIYSKIDSVNIIGSVINGNLYKIYYTYKPEYVIFSSENISDEIVQFISDFHNIVKCYIYHNIVSVKIIDVLNNFKVIHINNSQIPSSYNNFIYYPKNIVNKKLFYKPESKSKKDSIVCFLDNQEVLPEKLNNILYPRSKIPIKLFNNPRIASYQNLGMINEIQKAKVLQEHGYYLSLGSEINDYSIESRLCGCNVIALDDIHNYKNIISQELNPDDTIDHSTFITESILT